MVMEQAGAACTDGERRIMDIQPETLHQRTPLVFGSTEEVAEAARYFSLPPAGEISPLFAERGLFRT
jgi:fructose-1,6-bisphosphatase I